jgi:hypothetical protein
MEAEEGVGSEKPAKRRRVTKGTYLPKVGVEGGWVAIEGQGLRRSKGEAVERRVSRATSGDTDKLTSLLLLRLQRAINVGNDGENVSGKKARRAKDASLQARAT